MELTTLDCPRCGGLLPKQARWRMIKCPYCGRTVTLCDEVVQTAEFRQAWLRARARENTSRPKAVISGRTYAILARIGGGDFSEVFLAERTGILPERVVIKLKKKTAPDGVLRNEYGILNDLQSINGEGSAYFSQRLPIPAAQGLDEISGREALVLREPVGFWGSLDDVRANYPGGITARHAVWMWRRILEVLGFVHENGWSHGDIRTGHLLVHPGNHGILIIGWGSAEITSKSSAKADDLMRSAWAVREMLSGGGDGEPGFGRETPDIIIEVLKRASEDADWCVSNGAHGIDEKIRTAALEAYGPPAFIPFSPDNSI
jgi:serine/threonine protein kinase